HRRRHESIQGEGARFRCSCCSGYALPHTQGRLNFWLWESTSCRWKGEHRSSEAFSLALPELDGDQHAKSPELVSQRNHPPAPIQATDALSRRSSAQAPELLPVHRT